MMTDSKRPFFLYNATFLQPTDLEECLCTFFIHINDKQD